MPLSAFLAACMTDMLFHMPLICQNLVLDPNIDEKMQDIQKNILRTCDKFGAEFKLGYEPLAQIRQNIKFSSELINALEILPQIELPYENKPLVQAAKVETRITLRQIYSGGQETMPAEANELIHLCVYLKRSIASIEKVYDKLGERKNIFNDFNDASKRLSLIVKILLKISKTFEQYEKIISRYAGNPENKDFTNKSCLDQANNFINFLNKDSEEIKKVIGDSKDNNLLYEVIEILEKTINELKKYRSKFDPVNNHQNTFQQVQNRN